MIGAAVEALDTPALVVDADLMERNIQWLADYFAGRSCCIRPHFKSHKCVELARRQLAAGSTSGITCAKLSEAEQLVAGGISDVLIANQVVGRTKAVRLALLNREATVRSAVDSVSNTRELDEAAREAGTVIPVLVEVDVGMGRCGVPPGAAAIDLAQRVAEAGGLRLDGLQGYEGHLVCLPDDDQRTAQARAALQPLVETRRAIETAGLPIAIVSSGGTGTFDVTGNITGIDEVQCGSYALMDWFYASIRAEFKVARWVLATVISAQRDCCVVDVGAKGIGAEFGLPRVAAQANAKARYLAEEHTPFDNLKASVGEKVRLVPSHGCTTQNLYRKMWVARRGRIEDVWPIEGSGCLE